ncbi:hypothetical protein L1987_02719 [Smallanthus sonchifolius]|uniref:Uncharacterized protein n=1 Tax=Smallanthus sonchifolius TaxID=185202 RepID=A0ACB9K8L2_9ASTR|nr:hypothetical protein L1987_02719 [Smallanthus sonchifolius]
MGPKLSGNEAGDRDELQEKKLQRLSEIEKMTSEVDARKECIALVDEKLKELGENRLQVLSEKNKSLSKIAALEEELNGYEEQMREAEREFDRLASAPF